jgi:hypothetical protein
MRTSRVDPTLLKDRHGPVLTTLCFRTCESKPLRPSPCVQALASKPLPETLHFVCLSSQSCGLKVLLFSCQAFQRVDPRAPTSRGSAQSGRRHRTPLLVVTVIAAPERRRRGRAIGSMRRYTDARRAPIIAPPSQPGGRAGGDARGRGQGVRGVRAAPPRDRRIRRGGRTCT